MDSDAFKKCQIIAHAYEQALAKMAEKKEGDLITYAAFEEWTGLKFGSSKFKTVLEKLRKRSQFNWRAEPGVGYRMCKSGEFHRDVVEYRQKRVASQHNKAKADMKRVDVQRLSETERRTYAAADEQLTEDAKLHRRSRTLMRAFRRSDDDRQNR